MNTNALSKKIVERNMEKLGPVFSREKNGLGHNIGHSVGWVERSETQQLIGVGFRSSTQPTGNPYGLKYDQGQKNYEQSDYPDYE
jgi:hypothetical protein